MNTEFFMTLRLVGRRFLNHSLPIEFLSDIVHLKDLVLEMAKTEYLDDHSDRRRTPNGFAQSFDLRLAIIKPGSTQLGFKYESPKQSLIPPSREIYLSRGRDRIIKTINRASSEGSVENLEISERSRTLFDKLGHSLSDDEAIEFRSNSSDHDHVARLTKEINRRIVSRPCSPVDSQITREVVLEGLISELNQARMTFQIELFNGNRLRAPLNSNLLDSAIETLKGYGKGLQSRFSGKGLVRQVDGRVLKIISIDSIINRLKINAQLDDIRALKDGWLEGAGKAPPHAGIEWLDLKFETHFQTKTPLPYLYPTETGGIQAEWSLGPHEISLDMHLDTHLGIWNDLNLDSDLDDERQLNLDEDVNWNWLVKRITELSGQQ